MHLWKRLLFPCLVAIAPALMAADATNTMRVMSLDDCIGQALLNSFDVQIQRRGPEISLFDLRSSYGAYDPILSANAQYSEDSRPGGLNPNQGYAPFPGTESSAETYGGDLSGLLPMGTRYRLGGQFRSTEGDRALFPFEDVSGNVGALSLSQPLLRNFWIDGTRFNIAVSRSQLRTSELLLRQQVIVTITSVENAYYNLIFARENVEVQLKALELANRLLEENKTRVRVGAMAELDEKQSEAEVAARKADVLSAQQTFENQQNLLKNLLTTDYMSWHKVGIEPSAKLDAIPVSVQLEDSWMKGMTMRPDLEQARENVQRQKVTVKYQHNQLFPQLDLVGSFGYNASVSSIFNPTNGQPIFRQGWSDAYDQIAGQEFPSWSFGAQVSIPLGNRTARNNYKAGKAAQEQLLLQLKKLEQGIMVEIDDAVGNVRTAFERVAATREARKFAFEAWEAEKKKLANGKSTSFQVLQLQRDLATAASTEIRALADYNIALSILAQSEGSTLERHKIDFSVK